MLQKDKIKIVMKPLLSSSQRYYQHRKIRRLGYRMDARKRTIYIPANTPPQQRTIKDF